MKTVYIKAKLPDDAVVTSIEYSPKGMPKFTGLYTTDFEIQSETLDEPKKQDLPIYKSWKELGKRKRY